VNEDKCPECGEDVNPMFGNAHMGWNPSVVSESNREYCLRRQLAAANANLAMAQREIERLRGMFALLEWSHDREYTPNQCPVCRGCKPNHMPACALAAALNQPDAQLDELCQQAAIRVGQHMLDTDHSVTGQVQEAFK